MRVGGGWKGRVGKVRGKGDGGGRRGGEGGWGGGLGGRETQGRGAGGERGRGMGEGWEEEGRKVVVKGGKRGGGRVWVRGVASTPRSSGVSDLKKTRIQVKWYCYILAALSCNNVGACHACVHSVTMPRPLDTHPRDELRDETSHLENVPLKGPRDGIRSRPGCTLF